MADLRTKGRRSPPLAGHDPGVLIERIPRHVLAGPDCLNPEEEFRAGEIWIIPPGHDAWVLGDEPVVALEFTPATTS